MSGNSKWLIYGATGYTGKLIARQAAKSGHHPMLAGRSAQKLKPLAQALNLEWIAFDLTDKIALAEALNGVSLVLNTAGPFGSTVKPLVEACLSKGIHYLDIANEVSVYQLLLSYDQEAQKQNIVLMSGVGFGTVATNFLAKEALRLLPDAQNLEVAIAPYNYTTEPATGATQTALEVIAEGGKIYRKGKLVSDRLGKTERIVTSPDGETRKLLSSPLGDLVAAQLVTAVPNVTAYLELPLSKTVRRIMPAVRAGLRIGPLRKALQKQIARSAAKPTTASVSFDPTKHSYAWVRASKGPEKVVELWLETGEGYEFSALSSVKAVERVLELHLKGTLAPAQAFEADFALQFEGVKLIKSASSTL